MKLAAYLDRIGYSGPVGPDYTTLCALHRAHLLAVPYENLDIHLGRPLTLDEPQIVAKLVGAGRGGWCYEMNGLFAWALRQLGFEVQLLASAVDRAASGAAADGNHLVLLVQLERPYLADVGFGNGFLEPLPLAPGTYRQGYRTYALTLDGERWNYAPDPQDGPGYDFTLAPYQLADFAEQSHRQQTAPHSGFVRTTVCHRLTRDAVVSLRGALLSTTSAAGVERRVIADANDYQATLADRFGLQLAEAPALWERVWARHQAWLREQAAPAVVQSSPSS